MMSKENNIILIVVFVCFVVQVSCLSNCTLRITEENVVRTDIECLQYRLLPDECKKANSDLPILDDDNGAIETATNFQYVVLTNSYIISGIKWTLPQVTYSWQMPKSAAALRNLKGFMLDTYCIAGTDCPKPEFCVMFDMRNNFFHATDAKLKFNWKSDPMNYTATYYQFELYSLPRSKVNPNLVKKHYANVISAQDTKKPIYPGRWHTSISFFINENSVSIRFEVSKFEIEEYNFDTYEVILMPSYKFGGEKQTLYYVQKKLSVNFAECTFKDVLPGKYKIEIQPYDTYFNDDYKCFCFDNVKDDGSRYCSSCILSSTKYFNVERLTSPSTSTPVTTARATVTSDETTNESPSITNSNVTEIKEKLAPTKIGLAVLGSLVGVAVVVVIIFVFLRRKRSSGLDIIKQNGGGGAGGGDSKPEAQIDVIRVFILNADDHCHHIEAVKQLVFFLEAKCGCDVIYPPWKLLDISQAGYKNWVLKCLDYVDYVILVNSEASYKICEAFTRHETYKYKNLSATGHLFLPFLQEVMKEAKQTETLDKYIAVSFDYTSTAYCVTDLPTKHQFKLIGQIAELVQYINGTRSESHIHKCLRDVLSDNTILSESLESLNSVMNKAARFEKSDVLWFLDRFGSVYNRNMIRNDSGYEEHDLNSGNPTIKSVTTCDGRDEFGFYPPEDVESSLADDDSRIIQCNNNLEEIRINMDLLDKINEQDAVCDALDGNDNQLFEAPDTISSFDKQSTTPSTYFRKLNARNEHLANGNISVISYDC